MLEIIKHLIQMDGINQKRTAMMGQKDRWLRYQQYLYRSQELGISLDISRMSFSEDYFKQMSAASKLALKEMQALESGELVNSDENRMVGHYWLRTPELSPSPEIRQEIDSSLDAIKQFAEDVHSGSIRGSTNKIFKNVLLIGIGGSALGPQFLAAAATSSHDKAKLFFIDNTDTDGMNIVFRKIGDALDQTLVIVVSKSGGTKETRNGCLVAQEQFSRQNLEVSKHFVAITLAESKLDQQAIEEGWLKRFFIWDWVGGRTSIFSAVGLLPAALMGIDIDSFLEGAKLMDSATRESDIMSNPAVLLALMWHYSGRGTKDMVVIPYKDRLLLLSKYLQQLVMESIGKEKDRDGKVVHQGLSVFGNKGSTDQHALIQQLRDGINNFFATFIQVGRDNFEAGNFLNSLEVEPGVTSSDYLNGLLLGTREAFTENARDSITIRVEQLNAQSIGALIALYDRAVGIYASVLNINAYHQPGVEAGKKAAAKIIDLQAQVVLALTQRNTPASADEIAAELSIPDQAEQIFHILSHLASNERIVGQKQLTILQGESPSEDRFALQ